MRRGMKRRENFVVKVDVLDEMRRQRLEEMPTNNFSTDIACQGQTCMEYGSAHQGPRHFQSMALRPRRRAHQTL